MSVLSFLCDLRFHKSYVLPPNPDTGRRAPYRVSYADYGDSASNAVVLFCGALMGSRFCYSPLDQLAKAYNVRIIHPDRPGIGGSQPVDLDKRIQTWLEVVPLLLTHLNITHVSLASHSGGDIYLLNTMLTYPSLLHPETPYICFFAPWVHHSHSKVSQLRATDLLPAPIIGKFVSVVKFVNDNVTPLAGLSGGLVQGIRDSIHRTSSGSPPSSAPAPIPLTPTALSTRKRGTSLYSQNEPTELSLDDDAVVEELRRHITAFLFAECMDGIQADVQLFLRKPRCVTWCSSSVFWSDFDYAVPLISKMIDEEEFVNGVCRIWTVDTFHAQADAMVGERGRKWFDNYWLSHRLIAQPYGEESLHAPYLPNRNSYSYRSHVVEGTEHNYLMDPAFGASEAWLQRVRDSFPLPEESEPEAYELEQGDSREAERGATGDDASSSSTRPIVEDKRRSVRRLVTSVRRRTRDASSRRPRLRSKKPRSLSARLAGKRPSASDETFSHRPGIDRLKSDGWRGNKATPDTL